MKWFIAFLISLVSLSALAANIEVKGRAYSSTNCGYYSSSKADLRVKFSSEELNPGSRVFFRFGFREDWRKESWLRLQEREMRSIGQNGWVVEVTDSEVDSRGSYFFSHVEFAFRIVNPDGSESFDNAGLNAMSFYSAELPKRECTIGDWITLELRGKGSKFDY